MAFSCQRIRAAYRSGVHGEANEHTHESIYREIHTIGGNRAEGWPGEGKTGRDGGIVNTIIISPINARERAIEAARDRLCAVRATVKPLLLLFHSKGSATPKAG